MKLKKVLLTILLAILAIMLLQLNVSAEEVDYSEYDYLLTEEGVVAQSDLTSTESVIAGIKGEYTGTIETASIGLYRDVIKLNNFNADVLHFEEYQIFDIEGRNSINNLGGIRRVII